MYRVPSWTPTSVDGQHVGMIELASCAGLLLEPMNPLGVSCEVLGDNLDGHFSAQPRVSRPVNFAHAAGADPSGDFEGADLRTASEGHGRMR